MEKTIEDAKGEIARGIEIIEFAVGIPHLLAGSHTNNVGTNVDSWSVRQPLGVVGCITPFNFPAMVPMWMFVTAIACGNTAVVKPAIFDPSPAVFLAELAKEIGIPNGVLNIVQGEKEAVQALIKHDFVKAISFVGSTPVAKIVYETSASHGKRVQALGGAKNHAVIMPDAIIDQTCDAIMGAAYGSAGERCMAISVVVAVGKKTANEFIKQMKIRIEKLQVGPYDNPSSEMGPVITKKSQERIISLINSAEGDGGDYCL